jgi:hypothetical protein
LIDDILLADEDEVNVRLDSFQLITSKWEIQSFNLEALVGHLVLIHHQGGRASAWADDVQGDLYDKRAADLHERLDSLHAELHRRVADKSGLHQ